jgi:hypothetical protein
MALLTDAQRAEVYFFCGWPQRWVQENTALEQAMNAIGGRPEMQALLSNSLVASPKGLLAQARLLYDVTIPATYRRLKATKVGTIELDARAEIRMLRDEGRRLVNGICTLLGVTADGDVFGPGEGGVAGSSSFGIQTRGPGGGGNWIGK